MLRVHFLNVGHGDCTVIEHPSGRLTMIDINNSQDYDPESFQELLDEERRKAGVAGFGGISALAGVGSPRGLGALSSLLDPPGLFGGALGIAPSLTDLARADAVKEITDPIEFLKKTYPGRSLFRFILTHPDLDHMRGLKRLHENVSFTNFWDTAHTKPAPSLFKGNADQEDWKFYQSLRNGGVAGPFVHKFTRGDSAFAFGRDEAGKPGGDNIEILSPTRDLVRACNLSGKSNDLSLALRVRHGAWSVLLPGDAEEAAWKEMVSFHGATLKSDYLKASHHGRDSGYYLDAVKLIAPRVTFVSVGRKPDTDASSKYRQQCPRVASTRHHGNMELRFHDNGTREWIVERNADN